MKIALKESFFQRIEDVQPFPAHIDSPLQCHRPLKFVKWCRKWRKVNVKKPWLFYDLRVSQGVRTIPKGNLTFTLLIYDRTEFFREFSNDPEVNSHVSLESLVNITHVRVDIDVGTMKDFVERRQYYYSLAILKLYLKSRGYIIGLHRDSESLNFRNFKP
jgi:hypothetical protein